MQTVTKPATQTIDHENFPRELANIYRKRLIVQAVPILHSAKYMPPGWNGGVADMIGEHMLIMQLAPNGTIDWYPCDMAHFAYDEAPEFGPHAYRKREVIHAIQIGEPTTVRTVLVKKDNHVETVREAQAGDYVWQQPSGEVQSADAATFENQFELVA